MNIQQNPKKSEEIRQLVASKFKTKQKKAYKRKRLVKRVANSQRDRISNGEQLIFLDQLKKFAVDQPMEQIIVFFFIER